MRVSGQGVRVWLIAIMTLLAAHAAGQDFTISTVAGGAPPPQTTAPETASIGKPEGIAVDAAGNVYFSAGHCVLKLSATTGELTVVAGNSRQGYSGDIGAATQAQLNTPRGLAVDSFGNLYIADKLNNRIRKVSWLDRTITTVAGTGFPGFSGDAGAAVSAALYQPDDVAVDSNGDLYIADQMNNRIRRVSGGIITTIAGNGDHGFSGDTGPATSAALSWPSGVAVGGGYVYIADTENNRVRAFVSGGNISTLATDFLKPRGVAVDNAGNVLVADTNNSRISRVLFGGIISVVTVAGTGSLGFSGDDGPALSAQLAAPMGVAGDATGKVYIADTSNYRIRRISFDANISTVAGDGTSLYSGDGGPATSAQMAQPMGVAVDGAGNLYIADYGNSQVRRVSASGIISTVVGGPAIPRPGALTGVATDGAGDLYFSDSLSHVRRLMPDGSTPEVAENAQFYVPWALTFDNAGNLYVADMGRNRVVRVTPEGVFTTVAGTGGGPGYSGDGGAATQALLNGPRGVAVDGAGNLYISDAGNQRLRRVSPGGTITTVAGDGTQGFSGDGGAAVSARLDYPTGVGTDGAGNIYVADGWNHRIRRISPSGTITTVAGTGGQAYTGDGGPAISAQLANPAGIAVDSMGRVYFSTRNAVRMLTPVCATSAAPNAWTPPIYGGSLTLTIQATAGCAWSITGLPAWITASPTSGWGPGTATLTALGNMEAPRSATITAAGTPVTVTQSTGGGLCSTSIDPYGQGFTTAGGTGSIAVSARCGWNAVSQVPWITITGGASGPDQGTITYQVAPNADIHPRSGAIQVSERTFTVEQLGIDSPALVSVGSMPQIASGNTWMTTFTLVNNGTSAARARLTFTGDDGAALVLPVTYPQQAGVLGVLTSAVERDIPAGATVIIESEAAGDAKQGWAELFTDGAVSGFAVFRQRLGEGEQEAVVPLESRAAPGYVLAFDNTGGFVTSVAVANTGSQGDVINMIIRSDDGTQIGTADLNLSPRQHMADELYDLSDKTIGIRGTIEFRPPAGGQISVLGLRFHPAHSFTSVPVMAK